MKKIKANLSNYVEAPIDDKNVMSDSIIESLFDDGSYVWEKNEAMGFIAGYPCVATYNGNRLDVGTALRFPDTAEMFAPWCRTIIERVTGGEYTGNVFISQDKKKGHQWLSLLDNNTETDCEENQLISSFWMYWNCITIRFYYNTKKQ